MVLLAYTNSNYDESTYIICGVPFDKTSCFRRGSRFAPDEIRKNSYNFERYNHFFGIDLDEINIHDIGNIDISNSMNIDETLDILSVHANKYISDDKIPIMLGGEHSLSLPFVNACKNRYNNILCIVLDAHLDLRKEYEGEKNSHACISRNIIDNVTENYISIGIRSGSKDEYDYIKEKKIRTFSAEYVLSTGINKIIEEIIEDIIKLLDIPVYLSIDMDVIDPAYAPAVGTPEPYGLTPRDIRYIIINFAPYVVGFDIVEISPPYDSGNTALLGAKFIGDLIAAKAKDNKKDNKIIKIKR